MQLRDYIDSGELDDVYILSLGGDFFMIKVCEVTGEYLSGHVTVEATWAGSGVRHLMRDGDEQVYIEVTPKEYR